MICLPVFEKKDGHLARMFQNKFFEKKTTIILNFFMVRIIFQNTNFTSNVETTSSYESDNEKSPAKEVNLNESPYFLQGGYSTNRLIFKPPYCVVEIWFF